MDAQKVKEEIKKLYEVIKNKVSTNLLIVLKDGDEFSVKKIDITENIGDDFYELMKKNVERIYFEILEDKKGVEDYDASYDSETNYSTIPSASVDYDFIKHDLDNPVNITICENLDESILEHLWGYCIVITDNKGEEVSFFTKHKPSYIISSSKFMTFVVTRGKLSSSAKETITIPRKIDAMLFRKRFIILNKYGFEKIFGFEEKFQENADKVMEEIKKKDFTIENFDEFNKSCQNDSRIIRKLSNIYDKGYYKGISFDTNKKLIKEFKLDKVKALDDARGKRISYSGNEGVWQVLKLFDDDCLKSPATENNYLVGSKRKV